MNSQYFHTISISNLLFFTQTIFFSIEKSCIKRMKIMTWFENVDSDYRWKRGGKEMFSLSLFIKWNYLIGWKIIILDSYINVRCELQFRNVWSRTDWIKIDDSISLVKHPSKSIVFIPTKDFMKSSLNNGRNVVLKV